jgi:hypothetical protein
VILKLFGKEGCKKCKILLSRLHKLLKKPEYSDFKIEKADILKQDDLVDFCELEALNPQQIPALVVYDEGRLLIPELKGDYYTNIFLGMRTNYDKGGTITPNMLIQLLDEALKQKKGQKDGKKDFLVTGDNKTGN